MPPQRYWFDQLCATQLLAESALRVAKKRSRSYEGILLRGEPIEVATALRGALRRGEYEVNTARVRVAQLDKPRELVDLDLGDAILHDAMSILLAERLEPHYSPHVYSYRPRRSSWGGLRDVFDYLRHHRQRRPDPRDRGLYVFRADVRKYGETLPVGPRSALWVDLAIVFPCRTEAEWRLLMALVRPTVLRPECGEASPVRGVLIGSPLATILLNLYLMGVDRELETMDCHYSRFGDDILLISSDADVIHAAKARLETLLAERGLRLHADKLQLRFWNGAGRPSAAHPEFPGAAHLDYLGARLDFGGGLSLPREKLRAAIADIRQRLQNTRRYCGPLSREDRLRLLCGVVKQTISPKSGVSTHYASWLRSILSDRQQLRQLDFLVALEIAELVTGQSGVRAFRYVSYRALRRTFGLPSVVMQRNGARSG